MSRLPFNHIAVFFCNVEEHSEEAVRKQDAWMDAKAPEVQGDRSGLHYQSAASSLTPPP
jgi:hypothetical protein